MFSPQLQEIQEAVTADHRYFPVATHLEASQDFMMNWLSYTHEQHPHQVLLESGRSGRYHILAYQPVCRLYGQSNKLIIEPFDEFGRLGTQTQWEGPILESLQRWMSTRKSPSFAQLPDFCGGLAGFFSYDLVRQIEQLPQHSQDDLHLPDVHLLAFEQLIVFDKEYNQHWLIQMAPIENTDQEDIQHAYEQAKNDLSVWHASIMSQMSAAYSDLHPLSGQSSSGACSVEQLSIQMKHSFHRNDFVEAVGRVQDYIASGDVFQVNLSIRQSLPAPEKPLDVYRYLRQINPSPYMGFLDLGEMQIICGSPEQLIKCKGIQLSTRPIAGTRPRGSDREADLKLAKELIEHEKERAEHVMLVDLERNDLGKVCRYGSVKVDEFMVIEEYSHVMHIVSNVVGELNADQDAFAVIKAVFPGGTITGAPKIRTMEIIEELEPVRRGLYTGSIGWIDFNGDMELNIVIRTMLVFNGWAHVQAGAGIVQDSIPDKEYQESLHKAEAIWDAYRKAVQDERRISLPNK